MPTIWSTKEVQDETNLYKFDTYIRGTNLENHSQDQWVCYYFFYELEAQSKLKGERDFNGVGSSIPFKIDYASLTNDILDSSDISL